MNVIDAHSGEPAKRAAQFALETFRGFQQLEVRFILIGGWAVRSLGSPVPSIDLDCLIRLSDWQRYEVHDFIEERKDIHREAYSDSYLEVEAIEWTNRLWRSEKGFGPEELLNQAGTQWEEVSILGETLSLELPAMSLLFMMKWKAFRDRALQYIDTTDPVHRARLPPIYFEDLEGIPPEHFLRKAAKDLVDLAFLLTKGADPANARSLAKRGSIYEGFKDLNGLVSPIIVDAADDLAHRHNLQVDVRSALDQIMAVVE